MIMTEVYNISKIICSRLQTIIQVYVIFFYMPNLNLEIDNQKRDIERSRAELSQMYLELGEVAAMLPARTLTGV